MDKEQHEESTILAFTTNGETVPAEFVTNGKTEQLTINTSRNTKELIQNLKWLNTQPDEITADNALKILISLGTATINDIPSEYHATLNEFLTSNLLYQETISEELKQSLIKLQNDIRNKIK